MIIVYIINYSKIDDIVITIFKKKKKFNSYKLKKSKNIL